MLQKQIFKRDLNDEVVLRSVFNEWGLHIRCHVGRNQRRDRRKVEICVTIEKSSGSAGYHLKGDIDWG